MKQNISVLVVIFCLVCGSIVHGAVIMKFSGEVDAELRYTPENEWEGWDCLWLKSSVESSQTAKAVIIFGENNAQRGKPTYWWDPEGRRFSFYVDQFYMTYIGSLYSGASPSMIKFGDLSFAYHPHLLKLDYWDEGGYLERDYDQSKRGILLKDFKLGEVNSNAFYLWDGTGQLTRYTYGYYLEKPINHGIVKFYGVDFLDKPELIQKVKAIEAKKVISESFTATAMVARLSETNTKLVSDQAVEEQFFAYLWDINGSLVINRNQTIALRYIDFPKDFDPVYRDRTPRYSPYTNQRLAWNELDRYFDQKGLILSYVHDDKTTTFGVSMSNLTDHNTEYPSKTREVIFRGKINFLGKVSFNFWERFVDINYSRVDELFNSQLYHSSKYFVERPFLGGKFLGRYAITSRSSNFNELGHELSIGQEVTQGSFAGCAYRMGVKYLEPEPKKFFPFLEFTGNLPLGINITTRYSGYNRSITNDYEYDEDDQLLNKDNIFSVRAKISF